MTPVTDLSPLLKVSARLLDLHDSRRRLGESAQYQTEERSGLGDGRYFSIGSQVLAALQEHGKRSGDEYASLVSLTQHVSMSLDWAQDADIEYVLNVLSRPTELKLLHTAESEDPHLIGDKETNLVDKAAHISEFRLSRIGKIAMSMASDHLDITYIEGDVIKLIRALESGRMGPALGFVERLIDQLRTEHLSLVSLVERSGAGARRIEGNFDDLATHSATMQRAVEMVKTAQIRVEDIIRNDMVVRDEVPVGLVRERIHELSRGIVRYAREISQFAAQSANATSTSVSAPSFAQLARHWILASPADSRIDQVLLAMGPVFVHGIVPQGTDFAGLVKARSAPAVENTSISLTDYELPAEHTFSVWLQTHQKAIEEQIANGGLDIHQAIAQGMASINERDTFDCLVTALTSLESWSSVDDLQVTLDDRLSTARLQSSAVMFSRLMMMRKKDNDNGGSR